MSCFDLSIIITTYNHEKYITQTLESILPQIIGINVEVLIGDDCSVDNTQAIIREYQKKHPYIIKPIFRSENLGLISNYFDLLSRCQGELIMQCAGDDYWLPGKVQKQVTVMDNKKIAMCYSKALIFVDSEMRYKKELLGNDRSSFSDLITVNNIPALTVCIRNHIVKKYVNEIDPVHRDWKMEDYPMWLWIALTYKIVFIDECLCVYRWLENSASRSNSLLKTEKFEQSILDIQSYFVLSNNIVSKSQLSDSMYRRLILVAMNLKERKRVVHYYSQMNFLTMKEKIKLKILSNTFLFELLIRMNKVKKYLMKL